MACFLMSAQRFVLPVQYYSSSICAFYKMCSVEHYGVFYILSSLLELTHKGSASKNAGAFFMFIYLVKNDLNKGRKTNKAIKLIFTD